MTCIVRGCGNHSRALYNRVKFHKFVTNDSPVFQSWLDAVGMTEAEYTAVPRCRRLVCSRHFTASNYKWHFLDFPIGHGRLQPHAVPNKCLRINSSTDSPNGHSRPNPYEKINKKSINDDPRFVGRTYSRPRLPEEVCPPTAEKICIKVEPVDVYPGENDQESIFTVEHVVKSECDDQSSSKYVHLPFAVLSEDNLGPAGLNCMPPCPSEPETPFAEPEEVPPEYAYNPFIKYEVDCGPGLQATDMQTAIHPQEATLPVYRQAPYDFPDNGDPPRCNLWAGVSCDANIQTDVSFPPCEPVHFRADADKMDFNTAMIYCNTIIGCIAVEHAYARRKSRAGFSTSS